MICGIYRYGRVHVIPRQHSLTTLIRRSMSPTCSDAAVVLRMTLGTWSVTLLNSLSMRIVLTAKPALAYTVIIRWRRRPRLEAVQRGAYSIVVRFIRAP